RAVVACAAANAGRVAAPLRRLLGARVVLAGKERGAGAIVDAGGGDAAAPAQAERAAGARQVLAHLAHGAVHENPSTPVRRRMTGGSGGRRAGAQKNRRNGGGRLSGGDAATPGSTLLNVFQKSSGLPRSSCVVPWCSSAARHLAVYVGSSAMPSCCRACWMAASASAVETP